TEAGIVATVSARADANGGFRPVATLEGVRLRVADERRFAPFREAKSGPGALELVCEPSGEHSPRVRMDLRGDAVHVVVTDEVALRSPLVELSLPYRFVAGGPEETWVPLLQPGEAEVAGDLAFASPIGFMRAGTLALGLLPDLELLARE